MTDATAVVVGAGHAAGELSTGLRSQGWEGRIVLIGEEAHLPYQRPPLSKAYLTGQATFDALHFKAQATYERGRIDFMGGTRVTRIDRLTKRVFFSNGGSCTYDKLALTTGGRARPLGANQSDRAAQQRNFHYLRTVDDVDRIRLGFAPGKRLVIVGGGYVGLEVAAAAIQLGLSVTLLEAAPRLLSRVTAPEVSAFYHEVHSQAGVDIRTATQVVDFEFDTASRTVAAVVCSDGVRLPSDMVIVGVGLIPNTELAAAAGLEVDNGIVVDEYAQTSDPDIVSAGDCTNHPSRLYGRRIRLESVPNALEQARCAAASLCGKPRLYDAVPWFWSDQYDLKLKMVGLSLGHDQLVLRGTPRNRSFAAYYLKEGRVIAVDTVNRPAEFILAKRLVAQHAAVPASALQDETTDLKRFAHAT